MISHQNQGFSFQQLVYFLKLKSSTSLISLSIIFWYDPNFRMYNLVVEVYIVV